MNVAAVRSAGADQDLSGAEQRLRSSQGKPQDGLVSRYLNRPISRAISRLLLRTRVTPTAWTLLILPLPLAAGGMFLHGSWHSILAGTLLFQLYSILDGCDGEIARAKSLESESGARLDTWCDVASGALLALTMGFGISHRAEGTVVALLILLNEFALGFCKPSPEVDEQNDGLYARHRQLIGGSGILRADAKLTRVIVQITKRDVAILFFVLLAAVGRPAWILHLLAVVAIVTFLLTASAAVRRLP